MMGSFMFFWVWGSPTEILFPVEGATYVITGFPAELLVVADVRAIPKIIVEEISDIIDLTIEVEPA